MKKICTLSIFLLLYSLTFSQQTNNDWKLYPAKNALANDSTSNGEHKDTIYEVTPSKTPGTVKVSKDARIDNLSKELGTATDGTTVKIRGYRLQIIASSKKVRIDEERAKFIANKTDISTYIDYVQPNYKLRVGDFKTKLEAQKLQHELKATFPSALVVNDFIELSKIK